MKSIIPPSNGPSQRQLRVGELIQRTLSQTFTRGDLYHPLLLKTPITVSEVRMSVDLKHAFVFVTPLGSGFTKDLRQALKEEKPHLRRVIAREVNLRFAPELHFEEDTSFDAAHAMNQRLKSLEVSSSEPPKTPSSDSCEERDSSHSLDM